MYKKYSGIYLITVITCHMYMLLNMTMQVALVLNTEYCRTRRHLKDPSYNWLSHHDYRNYFHCHCSYWQ